MRPNVEPSSARRKKSENILQTYVIKTTCARRLPSIFEHIHTNLSVYAYWASHDIWLWFACPVSASATYVWESLRGESHTTKIAHKIVKHLCVPLPHYMWMIATRYQYHPLCTLLLLAKMTNAVSHICACVPWLFFIYANVYKSPHGLAVRESVCVFGWWSYTQTHTRTRSWNHTRKVHIREPRDEWNRWVRAA